MKNFSKILSKPLKVSFMSKDQTCNDEKDEKDEIKKEYLNIAKKYRNLNIDIPQSNKITKIVCDNCKNKDFEITECYSICISCGSMKEITTHLSSYKDVERVNMSIKYTYDRKVHFRDCLNQFQGKQNSTIIDDVYQKLINQFELHGLLTGNENTPKRERFSKITKEHIYLFLKEVGYSKHYEDVILIYSNITGKNPNNISNLEVKLLDDFDTLTDLYDKSFKKTNKIDRKNFINTQYVLFQLLRRHKYNCKKEDFNILKTIDRKSFHDEICKELFEKLGWNFTALF